MTDYKDYRKIVIDLQTDIKTAIKNGILGGYSFEDTQEKVLKIISKCEKIENKRVRANIQNSLYRYFKKIYQETRERIGYSAVAVLSIYKRLQEALPKQSIDSQGNILPRPQLTAQGQIQLNKAVVKIQQQFPSFTTTAMGIPNQEWAKDYIDKVDVALQNIANSQSIDANDITGRNSLRNYAEMEVRYQGHQDNINDLRDRGVKLVVCSTHADCSDRCAEWQGRIYSLDHTTGTTGDGRSYIPLETATDVYYTTKMGIRYKNGLLGFNCRHYLTEFHEGQIIPKVDEEERKRQDKINQEQRALERDVIHYRELALIYKGVNDVLYKQYRRKAIEKNKEYMEFSKRNGRAYYPDRVRVL